jgi:hypothetical protein
VASKLDQTDDDPIEDLGEEEEEIPRSVMLLIVTVAIVMAALYLSLGGGHSHFH